MRAEEVISATPFETQDLDPELDLAASAVACVYSDPPEPLADEAASELAKAVGVGEKPTSREAIRILIATAFKRGFLVGHAAASGIVRELGSVESRGWRRNALEIAARLRKGGSRK